MRAGRAGGLQLLVDGVDAFDEVVRGGLAIHPGVGEADLVGDDRIAEDHCHGDTVHAGDGVGAVERVGVLDGVIGGAREAVHT